MAKKTFTFATPPLTESERAVADTATPVDREILRKTVDDGVRQLENARVVALSRLHPDPTQPRRTFDPASLAELAESIRQEGVLQPLIATYRYEQDDFLIVSGERRYRAAQMAGLIDVPVIISNAGQTRRFLHQLIENLQREDLNAVDKGQALEHLKTLLPGTWQQMAETVGLTRRRVEQLRALPRLTPPLQEAVRANQVSEDHARTIGRLPESLHGPLLAAVLEHGLSTRQTKSLVARLQEESESVFASFSQESSEDSDTNPDANLSHSESGMPVATGIRPVNPPDGDKRETLDAQVPDATPLPPSPDEDSLSTPTYAPRPAEEEGSPTALVRHALRLLLDEATVRKGVRSRAAIPVYEKALEFERVLERMPALEYQEDRRLLATILGRIVEKIGRLSAE